MHDLLDKDTSKLRETRSDFGTTVQILLLSDTLVPPGTEFLHLCNEMIQHVWAVSRIYNRSVQKTTNPTRVIREGGFCRCLFCC